MMNTVELHPAFVYDCDECGRENTVRAIIPEGLTDEERDGLVEMLGFPSDEAIPTLIPTSVICIHCQTEFETDVEFLDGS